MLCLTLLLLLLEISYISVQPIHYQFNNYTNVCIVLYYTFIFSVTVIHIIWCGWPFWNPVMHNGTLFLNTTASVEEHNCKWVYCGMIKPSCRTTKTTTCWLTNWCVASYTRSCMALLRGPCSCIFGVWYKGTLIDYNAKTGSWVAKFDADNEATTIKLPDKDVRLIWLSICDLYSFIIINS